MKKNLLTLAAIAACAIGANAGNTLDLSLSDLGSGWSSSYDAATQTITYEGNWTGRGWWLGSVDYSAYTDVEITLSEANVPYQIVVQYNDDNGTSENSGVQAAGTLSASVALNDELKSDVMQIYIQCGEIDGIESPTLTLASAAVVDNSGAPINYVVWEGEQAISGWSWDSDKSLSLTPQLFGNLNAGDQLAFSITTTGGSIQMVEISAGWASNDNVLAFISNENWNSQYNTIWIGESGDLVLDVDADAAAQLKDTSNVKLMITGDGLVITKVEILPAETSSISAIDLDQDAPAVYYNLQGQRVANPANGIFVKVQGSTSTKVLVK